MRPCPFSSLYSVPKSKRIEPSGNLWNAEPPGPRPPPPRPAGAAAAPPAAGAAAGRGALPAQYPLRSGCPSAVCGVVFPSTEQPTHNGLAEEASCVAAGFEANRTKPASDAAKSDADAILQFVRTFIVPDPPVIFGDPACAQRAFGNLPLPGKPSSPPALTSHRQPLNRGSLKA